MIQQAFLQPAIEAVKAMPDALGLAIGGSWIYKEIDQFSDLDLILVTQDRVAGQTDKMLNTAQQLGELLNGFTGEHVGEPRLLICLYDNPLLHVDIKFLTLPELEKRVEDPEILWERDGRLTEVIRNTPSHWPPLGHQWLEDRFWTWVHYATLKIGRGEYLEALDFLAYLRTYVLSPLLQIKNGHLPRGSRKVEFNLVPADLTQLTNTIPAYNITAIVKALENAVALYDQLRVTVYSDNVILKDKVRSRVLDYLQEIKAGL